MASLLKKQPTSAPSSTSAPSGIAQLRKATDEMAAQQTPPTASTANNDPMNLDDFILPTSIASPAGLSPSPLGERTATSASAMASAIPIRKSSQLEEQDLHVSRASAPAVPPMIRKRDEFGYVQRRVRKTSIDERRVGRDGRDRTPKAKR